MHVRRGLAPSEPSKSRMPGDATGPHASLTPHALREQATVQAALAGLPLQAVQAAYQARHPSPFSSDQRRPCSVIAV